MTCLLLWPSAIWFAAVTTISSPAVVAFAGAVSLRLSRICWSISVLPTTSPFVHVRGVTQGMSSSFSCLRRQHGASTERARAENPEVLVHRRELVDRRDMVPVHLAPYAVDVVGAAARLQGERQRRVRNRDAVAHRAGQDRHHVAARRIRLRPGRLQLDLHDLDLGIPEPLSLVLRVALYGRLAAVVLEAVAELVRDVRRRRRGGAGRGDTGRAPHARA